MRRVELLFRHVPGPQPNTAAKIADLNEVFAPADLSFAAVDTAPASGLVSVDIGFCTTNGPTPAQAALFQPVALGPGQGVIFLASTLVGQAPDATGCASHPNGKPGVVVLANARRWVLAHEIGHMLELHHREAGLMVANPSQLPDEPAPFLLDRDIDDLARSNIPRAVGIFPQVLRLKDDPTQTRAAGGSLKTLNRSRKTVRALVERALALTAARRAPEVIDNVANTIARTPNLRRRYRSLLKSLGTNRLHRAIGREVRRQTQMVSSGKTVRGSSLIRRCAVLTPTPKRMRRPARRQR